MGGGVALLDYSNDGLLDIFLVSGGKLDDPVKLPANFSRRDQAYWNRLYRQNRDGNFTDVTAAAGLTGVGNDYGGRGSRRLQQRRIRGSLCHGLWAEHPLPQPRRLNIYRCYGAGGRRWLVGLRRILRLR